MTPARLALPVFAVLLLAAGAATAARPAAAPAPGEPSAAEPGSDLDVKIVRVTLRCEGEAVETAVDPYTVRIVQGDEIEWISEGADSMSIVQRGAWPFPALPPRARGRGAMMRSQRVPPGRARQAPYHYDIHAWCGDRLVVIDPDIVIGDVQ